MRFLAALLMVLHSVSLLLMPHDIENLNLRDAYTQCSKEDPDLTPLDFVFGHLLNLEYLMQAIEGEQEEEHQPLALSQTPTATPVVLPAAPVASVNSPWASAFHQRVYNLCPSAACCMGVHGRVFRPPVV